MKAGIIFTRLFNYITHSGSEWIPTFYPRNTGHGAGIHLDGTLVHHKAMHMYTYTLTHTDTPKGKFYFRQDTYRHEETGKYPGRHRKNM